MKEIRLNTGTWDNPTVIDTPFKEDEYVILESGVYILKENVVINEVTGNTIIDVMRESSQVNEMRESSQVKVMRESSQVKVMWGSSQVNEMRESSQVKVMRESSQVNEMWGSSQVNEMWGSSQVNEMWGSSQVNEMRESSQVKVMRESSQVKVMWGSSQVNEMWGSSAVLNIKSPNIKINCYGYNTLRSYENIKGVKLNESSSLIILPSIKGNFDVYAKNYPVKIVGNYAFLYKAVHKIGDKFLSEYDRSFEYKINKKTRERCDRQTDDSCSYGIHLSHLQWAVDFGKHWSDMAIIELKTPIKSIIVAADCDGKIRTSEAVFVRELPLSEYEQYL